MPAGLSASSLHRYRVLRRNGSICRFDPGKILRALSRVFELVETAPVSAEVLVRLTERAVAGITRRPQPDRLIPVEEIQDQVELALTRAGHFRVAQAYLVHREEHGLPRQGVLETAPLDESSIRSACEDVDGVDELALLRETRRRLHQGACLDDQLLAQVEAARWLLATNGSYSLVAARLLLEKLSKEAHDVLGCSSNYFISYLTKGIKLGALDPALLRFNVQQISSAIRYELDREFHYSGLQMLYEHYLLRQDGLRFELPQALFMRVAMSLALNLEDREDRAIAYYQMLSGLDFTAPNTALFAAGTRGWRTAGADELSILLHNQRYTQNFLVKRKLLDI
ncbi:MAG: hypothetical protein KF760_09095 [Candidatus Eremiobacteraeota bacterium]|nr:hypothetical protein [Candidatus Eremiobacteraeota bacterium]MCW5869265.1 hypothetical protein [Candidatus Eremiobacteraeota bacterium]